MKKLIEEQRDLEKDIVTIMKHFNISLKTISATMITLERQQKSETKKKRMLAYLLHLIKNGEEITEQKVLDRLMMIIS